jgi:hypothetical protein
MSDPMSVEQQLAYEASSRTRQMIIAGAAGVLLIVAAVIQLTGIHAKVEELTLDLITEHRRYPIDLIGAIVNGFALAGVAWTLSYMFGLVKARNTELRDFIRWLAIVGGALSAITAVIYALEIAHKADEFVHSGGPLSYEQANHLTNGGVLVTLPLIAQLASLVLTFGFVMIALNAMRVGLLTRFMGYLGILAGVLVLFPIGSPVPVVQGFWLLALAYLISGRWPSGLPASWRTGQIERWPTNAELREAREKAAGGQTKAKTKAGEPKPSLRPASKPASKEPGKQAPSDKAQAKGKPEPAADPETVATPAARTRASTPKRKRKRRH